MECSKLPTTFDNDRIFLNVNSDTDTLKFYTDSGGGQFPFVYDDTARKLSMTIEKTESDDGFEYGLSSFPTILGNVHIPLNQTWQHNVHIFKYNPGGADELSQSRAFLGDGFLGATFFVGHIWRFDYPDATLETCPALPDVDGMNVITMHFKKIDGARTTEQPRIEIVVMGQKLSVLFDTGGTSAYSKEAQQMNPRAKPFTASSFIRKSVADVWLRTNPDLKVIKGGDRFAGGSDLIEVPEVIFAGYKVGPIWFATRPDDVYDKYSTENMDARIDGAIGGNVLHFFEIVADYPDAKMYVRNNR